MRPRQPSKVSRVRPKNVPAAAAYAAVQQSAANATPGQASSAYGAMLARVRSVMLTTGLPIMTQ